LCFSFQKEFVVKVSAALIGPLMWIGSAQAGFLSFSVEVNSGGSPKLCIDNRSVGGYRLTDVQFDFRSSLAQADGAGATLAFVGNYGTYDTAVTASGLATYTGNLATDIGGGELFTFSFGSGFDAGEGFGVLVDIGSIRGGDINGAAITATFDDVHDVRFVYEGRSGNGRSFPALVVQGVPEPSAVGVLGALIGSLVFVRRHNRSSSDENGEQNMGRCA
jgi:hypothetical protein